jgi:hypothetical protein
MAWESRSGRRYYYRKQRVGQRVVSHYVGTGPLVDLLAADEDRERKSRARMARAWQAQVKGQQAVDASIGASAAVVRALTDATLIASGYRSHKGQWRKHRRGER